MISNEAHHVTIIPIGIMFTAATKGTLESKIKKLCEGMKTDKELWLCEEYRYWGAGFGLYRLAFVAKTADEVIVKCEMALSLISISNNTSWTLKGIIYCERPYDLYKRVTILFPGQGTQQVNMFLEVINFYPIMRHIISLADQVMIERGGTPVSNYLRADNKTDYERAALQIGLQKTENAQVVLAAVSSGLYTICKKRGLKADYFIGHSFGELSALWADGVYDLDRFICIARERGTIMSSISQNVSMLAVVTDENRLLNICKEHKQLYIANFNSPKQTVVSGNAEEMKQLESELRKNGIKSVWLKVSGAFHSPYMREASKKFREYMDTQTLNFSSGKVISNYTADFYPSNCTDAIKDMLEKQLLNPVLFQQSIKKAYNSGSRIFVEIGYGNVLTRLIDDILYNHEHETIALCPVKNRNSLEQFELAMAKLAVLGFNIK